MSGQQGDDGFAAPPPEEWANHELLMAGCEPGRQLNVAVLLSGGVDSSLALRLLKAAGHRNFWDSCPWEQDLEYARKVRYVVAKDTLHNAVLVSRQYYDDSKQRRAFSCGPFNWLHPTVRPRASAPVGDPRVGGGSAASETRTEAAEAAPEPLLVKVRHGPGIYSCTLWLHDENGDSSYGADTYGTVVLEKDDQGLAAGQYAVFYQGGRCLGCAVIRGTLDVGAATQSVTPA
ncbi:hypothetical protein GPECTOR_23g104 [Gonium pectorale]|uniref:tRNA-specific 2-thiouridylase MnmA-like C-terminal domain-containing protein n=1 Tax=Gonium pectorale TaxID=33097 RepID=A0A150GHC3_GONPE|nr:hypothetical protein GPECTOR_23g104 [Gonium pectorale]|eukprot:KXZ49015.1 hypothetical protein GPECTOR_23g104 [Gonium pectorale]